MIKNRCVLVDFEKSLLRKSRVNIQKNFRIFEALYQQAVRLGAFPRKNPRKNSLFLGYFSEDIERIKMTKMNKNAVCSDLFG